MRPAHWALLFAAFAWLCVGVALFALGGIVTSPFSYASCVWSGISGVIIGATMLAPKLG